MGNIGMSMPARTGARIVSGVLALAVVSTSVLAGSGAASAVSELAPGDSVYIGPKTGYSGTGMHAVYETPVDPSNLGPADFFAYCIEHNFPAKTDIEGQVGDASSFLGTNLFTQATIPGKVIWVLAHSYPALSLADFGSAAGVPGISENDAIEATQYAIWRYTDLGFDAAWQFETPDSETAYWYLLNGANASSGMSQADFATTVSVTGPAAAQIAGSLIGPFTVHTNQASAVLTADPSLAFTDAGGAAIDSSNVVDGQSVYLDARGLAGKGKATVTATVEGSGAIGSVISVPNAPGGTPTTGDHAQSMILVAPAGSQTTASAGTSWAAVPAAVVPSIRTRLLDAADGDHTLPAVGGAAVDTITYRGLTPGVEYTVVGRLMRESDGSRTTIGGSATFTPTAANGTVQVTFTVPAGYAGERLVAFETMHEGSDSSGRVVARHRDLGDDAQTIVIAGESGELAQTGSGSLLGIAGLGAVVALAGAILAARGRRSAL